MRRKGVPQIVLVTAVAGRQHCSLTGMSDFEAKSFHTISNGWLEHMGVLQKPILTQS